MASDFERVQRGLHDLDAARQRQKERQQQADGAAAQESGPFNGHDYTDDTGHGWPEPIPIRVAHAAQPYPLDALPEDIREAISEVQDFVQAPLSLVTCCALTALSLACQGLADVARTDGLSGPCSLFLLAIAESGERKSTCDDRFMRPMRKWQSEQRTAMAMDLRNHEANTAAWETEKKALQAALARAAGGKGSPEAREKAREAMRKHEQDKPTPPRLPLVVRVDETPESLMVGMMTEWPSTAIATSEGGLVFGGHAMGPDSIVRNLATLNVAWDGRETNTGRITRKAVDFQGGRLTVGLQIQEAPLREFFDKAGTMARGTGFMARFLTAWPDSTQGTRFFREAPPAWPGLTAYTKRLVDLLDTPLPLTERGTLNPPLLYLSDEARAAWVAMHDDIERELLAGGQWEDVRDVASKTTENAARLACLFHIFHYGPVGAIGADDFLCAAAIVTWHLRESQRFFGGIALPPELAEAEKLDDWLVAFCRKNRTHMVPISVIQKGGPGKLRTTKALRPVLQELDERNRAQERRDGRAMFVHVNPMLLV